MSWKNKSKRVKNLSNIQLKKCGLSRQKVKGIKELALKFYKKEFNPKLINNMTDEDAINYLTTLRQIGPWSAEMILLFTYNRSNIWPVQDIGLLRAISNNYKKIFSSKDLCKFFKKNFLLIALSLLGFYGVQ